MATVLKDPLQREMLALGEAARAAAAVLALAPQRGQGRGAAGRRRSPPRRRGRPILAANARDMAAARAKGLSRRHARPAGAQRQARRRHGRGPGDRGGPGRPGRHRARPLDAAPTAWTSPGCACPWAWSGSSTRAAPTSPPTPAPCASRPATPRSCAAARRASTPRAPSSPPWPRGWRAAGLPAAAIQLVPTADRAAVGHLLRMAEHVDVIVPRGGRSLIERVMAESRVPVLAHLEGNCHTYLHASADPAMAVAIAVNAKLRRTGVCGATETLLVDARRCPAPAAAVLEALIERRLRHPRRRPGPADRAARNGRRPSRTGAPNISTRSWR